VKGKMIQPGRGLFYVRMITGTIAFTLLIVFLSTGAVAQESGFGTVVDEDVYIVKPGDRFRVDFWDGVTDAIGMVVTPEGSILLPPMGKLEVADLSLSETKAHLVTLVKRFYPDIEFTVSLEGIRSVKVFVTGAVKTPGFYNGYVADRVSEFIKKAGGFIPGASRRNIMLHGGHKCTLVDLLLFERTGDIDANPFMYEGNMIHVPMITDSSSFVQISGAVVRPGGIEYGKKDNLGTIIDLAFGLNGLEDDSILIYRRGASSPNSVSVSLSDRNFSLMPGDKIVVAHKQFTSKPDYFAVTGEVILPGRFPYHDGLSLADALSIAQGVGEFGCVQSMTIFRRPEYDGSVDFVRLVPPDSNNNISLSLGLIPVSVDLDRYYPDKLADIPIAPGDSITIPRLTGSVTILGLIHQPGAIGYQYPMTVRDLVSRAGGYSPDADKGKIDIIKGSTGLRKTVKPGARIFDGDIVIVPEKVDKKSFLDKVRDISLILGGMGVVYLALDNASD
jgi:polysaccharide biosynthesis/export protein